MGICDNMDEWAKDQSKRLNSMFEEKEKND
jgi:hypothetical protein